MDIYEIAKDYLCYDGEHVRWKVKVKKSKYYPGDIAGTVDGAGYVRVALFRRPLMVHRFAAMCLFGDIPEGMQVDHIDHIRHNNKAENLRLVTHQGNGRNTKLSTRNTSGCVGVFWYESRGKWWAYIGKGKKRKSIGYYADWFDAVCARMSEAARQGYHENHGRH